MVNERLNQVYQHLKSVQEPLSGEKLGEKLGISKVAVWKIMGQLEDLGISLKRGPKGYSLEEVDPIHPYSFPHWAGRIHYQREMKSTMGPAREMALQGKRGLVVVTQSQSQGIDKEGAPWDSPPGGLYLTAITQPLNQGVEKAQALAKAFLKRYCLSVHHKLNISFVPNQVNEIYYLDKRIGGLILEGMGGLGYWHFLNLGLGIRTSMLPAEIRLIRHQLLDLIFPLMDDLSN